MMNIKSLFAVSTAAVALYGFSGIAQAALLNCPTSFTQDGTAKVTNATSNASAAAACQYLDPADPSNTAKIENINAARFFGFQDWTANAGNVQVDANSSLAGNWAINNVNFSMYDYLIVFKDGAGTNLVGFLLNELFSSGKWLSPFTNPPFEALGQNQVKGVSHYTIAQRLNPSEVPEPMTAALLGLGLAALGLARRRKHPVSQE